MIKPLYHPDMREYQKKALDFACTNSATYMAVDLGLGKTLTAIQWIKSIQQPTIVFAPLRVCYNVWPDEIKKWAPELSYTLLHGPKKSINFKKNVHIYIINYEGIKWLIKTLGTQRRWSKKAIIFDESAKIKSASTKRFKMLGRMQKYFLPYRMALCGEPSPNGLHELWSQYRALNFRPIGQYYTRFRNKYFLYDPMRYTTNIKSGCEQEIYKLVSPITYRLDADDYNLMPDVIHNDINVVLPKDLELPYRQLERDLYTVIQDNVFDLPNAMVKSGKLRQFTQGCLYNEKEGGREAVYLHNNKIQALQEIIDTNPNKNIICVVQFKFELSLLFKAKIKYEAIVGGVSALKSQDIIHRWNQGRIPLLVIHPGAVGEGLNLQYGGHIIVWLALPWNPATYNQVNGRLIRPDQKHTVVINRVVIEDSIDARVARVLKEKRTTQQNFLNYLREQTLSV